MKKIYWLVVALLIFSMLFVACKQTPDETTPVEPTVEESMEEPVEEPMDTPAEEMSMDYATAELAAAYAGEYAGKVVTVDGPFVDQDEVLFNATIASFEEATGIDIQYIGNKEFETSIAIRVDGGDAPDIADFPQPGLFSGFAASGDLVDLTSFLDLEDVGTRLGQSWIELGTVPGADGNSSYYGIVERVNGKSFVWYPKKAFDAMGYEVPTTWDEMTALMDLMVSDGYTPWCIGIESGTATGWPATDWVEEIMLRTTSLDNYDAWTKGELPFDSPEVKNAIQIMGDIWLNDAYVYGGRESIVSTGFGDAVAPMFTDPPGCFLHKQGNFITSYFPEEAVAGEDYDFFYLPGIDPQYGNPVLTAGDIFGMFNDRPEVRAVMAYFTYGEHLKEWMAGGGLIAPHSDIDLDWYGDPITRGIGEIILNANASRFDGSDVMPSEVGAGSFWKGMTDYVSGTIDLDTAVKEIDAAWPGKAEAMPSEDKSMDYATAELAAAYAGEYAGKVVTVDGPFVDQDEVLFNATIASFEEATGIDIQYIGNKEFETSIAIRVDGGDAPDIADFPQPGLFSGFAASGDLVDLSTFLDLKDVGMRMSQSWISLGTVPGSSGDSSYYGIVERVNGKSFVWYPKKAFDAMGYEVPTTWDEMTALMDLMVSDGYTPWCIGIESGTATGWPATDWVEEIMLRTTSLDNYDAWTKGELPFDSPEVKNAIQIMSDIWFNDAYVYGGRESIVSTGFGDAVTPMFTDPPGCFLHKQGNFITSYFPEEAVAGEDYDFFYLPGIDSQYGNPVLTAGDIFGMFNDRPEVRAVMAYFTYGEHLKEWMAGGGLIAPHSDIDLDWYGDTITRSIGEILLNATSTRFDGSDMMPSEVGAGSFWKGMTDYVSGTIDLDTAVQEIDAAWPAK